MNTTPGPTFPSPLLTSEQLTVLTASFSSLVFFVVIVIMLSVIYRKDPHCCKPRSYQASRSDMASPPQYYSSSQTLVGSSCEQVIPEDNMQSGQLFYVGLPSSYSLQAPMPRLPSYESVRKKDRQRHIHMMIADRFGLNGTIVGEPPPTYEESVQHSVETTQNISPSCLDVIEAPMVYMNSGFRDQTDDSPPAHCDTQRGDLPCDNRPRY